MFKITGERPPQLKCWGEAVPPLPPWFLLPEYASIIGSNFNKNYFGIIGHLQANENGME